MLCMWLLATIYKRKEREWGVRRFGRGEDGEVTQSRSHESISHAEHKVIIIFISYSLIIIFLIL